MYLNEMPGNKGRVYFSHEAYLGGEIYEGLYMAKVHDAIIDWDTGIWQVVGINPDKSPVLKLRQAFTDLANLDLRDDSIGVALSRIQNNTPVDLFLDRTKRPMELITDSAFLIARPEAAYMVFYQGENTGQSGLAISQKFSGTNVTSNRVELKPHGVDGLYKLPEQFTTQVGLKTGEVITGAVFDENSRQIGKQTFTICDSVAMRKPDNAELILSSISIVSPLVDVDNPLVINNSKDMYLAEKLKYMRLHYTNGKTKDIEIDGVKARIEGLLSTREFAQGRAETITLFYKPDLDESYINGSGYSNKFLQKTYTLRNEEALNDLGLKVYAIPRFTSDYLNWHVEWRLVNKHYELDIDVTQHVQYLNHDVTKFDDFDRPVLIDLRLDLGSVNPQFRGEELNQRIGITMAGFMLRNGYYAEIDYDTDSTNMIGMRTLATVDSDGAVDMRAGCHSKEEWLKLLFNTIEPIYDNTILEEANTPSHFRLEYQGAVTEAIEIDRWDRLIPLPKGKEAVHAEAVVIKWLEKTPRGYGVMGHSALGIAI
jgi:hypothetical protein